MTNTLTQALWAAPLAISLTGSAFADTPPDTLSDALAAAATAVEPPAPDVGPVTGYPMPRYVSMRASEGNARRGPSRNHRIDWVFIRDQNRPLPMMVVAEHGHWRRVVDRDGAGGWMHYTLLTGTRSGLVEVDMLPMHARPDDTSPVRAYAELGVTGRLRECQPNWCLFETGGFRGWVDPNALWGVEPGETFD